MFSLLFGAWAPVEVLAKDRNYCAQFIDAEHEAQGGQVSGWTSHMVSAYVLLCALTYCFSML